MHKKRTQSIVLAIMVWVALSLLASACGPAAPPVPTATPAPTAAPVRAAASTSDLLDMVKTYEDAFNRQDLEGVMALLTNDVVFQLSSFHTSRGKQDTQALVGDFFFGMNSEFHHTDCTSSEDEVDCKAIAINDWNKAAGAMEGYHYNYSKFLFKEDKILKIMYWGDWPSDGNRLLAFNDKFLTWLDKTYPDISQSWNTIIFAPDGGQLASRLTQEFAATLK